MAILKKGDKVALICLSNGLSRQMEDTINKLCKVLEQMELQPICSPYLYKKESVFSAEAKERAKTLIDFYKEDGVKAIFDVSGGDIANEVLEYLDYELIREKNKPFFGYSDLTTVVNALYTKTQSETYLYQIRNLVGTYHEMQGPLVAQSLLEDKPDLFDFRYSFVQGDELEGVVVGGNIRCLLKLGGTEFMPDFTDKVLFLESRSGGVAQMVTFLNQYKQMGVFNKVKGIILGTFTEMEQEGLSPTIEELVIKVLGDRKIPIVKTSEIGHGQDSKAIIIGRSIKLV